MVNETTIGITARRRAIPTAAGLLLLLSLAATTASVRTQEMPVPVDIQVPLLMKVLSADRELGERAGAELRIGVFYQARYRASNSTMEAFVEIAGGSLRPPLPGQSVRVVPVALDDAPDWDALITANDLDVCYVTPLRAINISGLLTATRAHGAVSCTGVPEYVESGVSVGFDTKGGKPQIVINTDTARAEGIDFTSQLLKLARIIRED